MPGPAPALNFDTDFDPQWGAAILVAPGIARITAPNATPFTFKGTNSYLIGGESPVLVDPGPENDSHLEALLAAIGRRKLKAILLTHTHKDHCALARRLHQVTGAPIWFGGQHRLSRPKKLLETNPIARSSDWSLIPDQTLADGDTIDLGEMTLTVIATPGHCANHLAFGINGTPFVLTGDHVMGWNSTLVAVPDGSMRDYLASLERLTASNWTFYLPAHGGSIVRGKRYAERLKAHRLHRNDQIIAALQSGPKSIRALLDLIYPDLPPRVRFAARMTLGAHLEYLEESDAIRGTGLFGRRYVAA